MELLKFIPLYAVILVVTMVTGKQKRMIEVNILDLIQQRVRNVKNREGPIKCAQLAKEPNIRLEMLLGRTWRVYYSWNMDLQKQCIDIKFWNTTPSIINRMHGDMSEFLMTEPQWDAPSVLLKMARLNQELLLFADQGSPGRFQGVPNLTQRRDILLNRPNTVPLPHFHLKLLYGGKYLLMADCLDGVTTLSASKRNIPLRAEIANIAKNLNFGPGLQACLSDKHKDEAK